VRQAQRGTVYLVGAGPGSPDLITLRGWHLLQTAEVVVADSLADARLCEGLAVELIDAGKRRGQHGMGQAAINALLVELAQAGKAVVRLKGGDPFVLGRGFEEWQALATAGVACEIVPGVSSAVAGPALAGIPVTQRGMADGFTVVSAHQQDGGQPAIPPFEPRCTLVVLMGVATLSLWWPMLSARGYPDDLPVAWVTWAGRADQRTLHTTVATCVADAEMAGLQSPSVAVIGRVAALSLPTALATEAAP
jgi:uroporphyrin-III C-methyltransferase